MSNSYLLCSAFFCAILYMMIVDKNFAEFFYLFFMGVWVQLKKYYYMVKLHPFWIMNPIGKWWMMRKYRKMAEEMMKSIKETNTNETDS